MSRWRFPVSTHAAKSTDLAKSAIDIATPAVPTGITHSTGMQISTGATDTPARRKSGVERYFRKARDRALRETTAPNPQADAASAQTPSDALRASASAGKADGTRRALQVAENEGWKYRDCVDRNRPHR